MYNMLQAFGSVATTGAQSFVGFTAAMSRMSEAQLVNLMVTNNQTLGINKLTTGQMYRKLVEAGVSKEIALSTVRQVKQKAATDAQTASTVAATGATGGLKAAMVGLGQVMKAHPFITFLSIAAVAIPIIIALYKKWNGALDEHAAEVEELNQEYESAQNELESVERELESVVKRIDELNAKGSLTLIEQGELAKLQETNAELERELAIKKQLVEESKRLAEEEAKSLWQDLNSKKTNKVAWTESGYRNVVSNLDPDSHMSDVDYAQYLIGIRKNLGTDMSTLFASESEAALREILGRVSKVGAEEADKLVDAILVSLDPGYAFTALNNQVTGEMREMAARLVVLRDSMGSGLLPTEELAKAQAEYSNLLDELWQNKDFGGFIARAKELGVITNGTAEEVLYLARSIADEFGVLGQVSLRSFTEVYDKISDGLQAISDAQKDMDDSGFLSNESVKKMEEAGLHEYLDKVEDGYKLAAGALEGYMWAQRQEYVLAVGDAVKAADTVTNNNILKKAGYDTVTKSIYDQIAALELLALEEAGIEIDWFFSQSGDDRARMFREMGHDLLANIEGAKANLETFDRIREQFDREQEQNAAKNTPEKDAFEAEYNKHKHAVAMEKETLAEFYAWLDGADGYKKYFSNNEKYIDEFRKYAEEVFNGYKDLISDTLEDSEHQIFLWEKQGDQEDKIITKYREMQSQVHAAAETIRKSMQAAGYSMEAIENSPAIQSLQRQWWECEEAVQAVVDALNEDLKDSLDDLLELTEDMIRQQKEDEIDALEETKEAYAKIVEQRKELLQLAEREKDYSDSVAEKTKELAKLEARRAALQLAADSGDRNAALQLGAINEEIAEKQKEISDEQRDHYVENTEDQLDREVESFEDAQDVKIKAIKDFLENNEEINKAALERLQNMNQQFYAELEAYALHYTDTTRAELQQMWADATEAAQQYGSVANALSAVNGDKTTTSSTASNVANVRAIVSQMEANSKSWHSLMTKEEKDALHADSASKAALLGQFGVTARYDSAHGRWYVASDTNDPSNVGKKLFDVYHSGGVVGGSAVSTPKQDEVFALLQHREIVLNENQQNNLMSMLSSLAPVKAISAMTQTFREKTATTPAMIDASLNIDGYVPETQMMEVLKRHQRDVANLVAKYFKT